MWNVTPTSLWDWADLKRRIAEHGVRNSLLLAPMPTASTAQILGNNESFEPYTTNIYSRRVLSGEFQVSLRLQVQYTVFITAGDGLTYRVKNNLGTGGVLEVSLWVGVWKAFHKRTLKCCVVKCMDYSLCQALRYKPEGRGFDSQWCHWIFSLT